MPRISSYESSSMSLRISTSRYLGDTCNSALSKWWRRSPLEALASGFEGSYAKAASAPGTSSSSGSSVRLFDFRTSFDRLTAMRSSHVEKAFTRPSLWKLSRALNASTNACWVTSSASARLPSMRSATEKVTRW